MSDEQTIRNWSDIPGFFRWIDRWVFATLLKSQQDSPPGNLVELGTYQGKSAVIIGSFLRPGERFVALDLFGREDLLDSTQSGIMNRDENRRQYQNLALEQFERNYLALHPELPEIHVGLSTDIVDLIEPASARFVHVDAGHMYDQVRPDVINAKTLLRPGGIVAFDDYRTLHTPGVSAAVWEAVFHDGLVPVALTPQKMYGIYDEDPTEYQEILKAFVRSDPKKWRMQEQYVLGRPVLRIKHIPASPAAKGAPATKKPAAKKTPGAKAQAAAKKSRAPKPASPQDLPHKVVRVIARDVAPPALTRWVKGRRAASKNRGWPEPTKTR